MTQIGVTPSPAKVDRDEAIAAIKAALKARTKTRYSVRGGRGTTWGWITVDVPPAVFKDTVALYEARREMNALFGISNSSASISIPGSGEDSYKNRATILGLNPSGAVLEGRRYLWLVCFLAYGTEFGGVTR